MSHGTTAAGSLILERGEQLVSLRDAAEFFPRRTGKKPHIASLHRFATRGVKGVILETVQGPAGKATSHEAVVRFLQALTTQSRGADPVAPIRSPARRERDLARAERRLTELGV